MIQLISIGQIVDKTFHLYEKHFGDYMRIALWMLLGVPLIIVSMVLFPLFADSFAGTLAVVILMFLNALFALCIGYGIFGGVVLSTSAFEVGKKPASIRAQIPNIVAKLFLQGLALGILVLGACLLVLPGVGMLFISALQEHSGVVLPSLGMFFLFFGGVTSAILIAYCIVVFPMAPLSLMLEKGGVVASIRRAFALVKGRWWATMLRVLVPKLTLLVIILFVQLLISLLMFVLSAALVPATEFIDQSALEIFVGAISQILSTLVAAVTAPVFIIADYYVFQSLVATRTSASGRTAESS